MKVQNNWIKITRKDGLRKLARYANDNYYESNPNHISFNLVNVVFLDDDDEMDQRTVGIAKGNSHITIELTEEAFKEFEELIFEEK
tara:strand:+ start:313 stop:570 length:258 start_codon:yes stop_codon:yes gene_type:complete